MRSSTLIVPVGVADSTANDRLYYVERAAQAQCYAVSPRMLDCKKPDYKN